VRERFAEWLELHPRPTQEEFAAFRDARPEIAAELDRLWRGLQQYERLREELLPSASWSRADSSTRAGPSRASASRRVLGRVLLAVAAAIVLVVLPYAFLQRERAGRCAAIAAATAATALDFADRLGDSGARSVLGEPAMPSPQPADPLPKESIAPIRDRCAESISLLEAANELSHEVGGVWARKDDRRVAEATATRCAPYFESSATAPLQRVLLGAAARAASVTFRGSPIALALKERSALKPVVESREVRRALPESIHRAIDAALEAVPMELRAIDLDAGGEELRGATVYVQELLFPSNELGSATKVGLSPWKGTLAPGEWRITVVDPERVRHSELRVLALPALPLGLQVAFLRSTAEVVQGMAHRDATKFTFCEPAELAKHRYPGGPIECESGELWVDPFEVTKARWADFHRAMVENGARWFDGAAPIDVLPFLDAKGECPPELADHPVTGVPWKQAVLFANWEGKRLPTEREWERIAKGAENRKYPWGDDERADAIDASHSVMALLAAARGTKEPVRFKPPKLDETTTCRVDDPAFQSGATPPADGDPVYRLADNVDELTEDPAIERLPDGSYAFAIVEDLLRVSRGGSVPLAGGPNGGNALRTEGVATRISNFGGLRFVKTPLPEFARE
jgi:formylglycine-generating enzyme required for sulfatase activity